MLTEDTYHFIKFFKDKINRLYDTSEIRLFYEFMCDVSMIPIQVYYKENKINNQILDLDSPFISKKLFDKLEILHYHMNMKVKVMDIDVNINIYYEDGDITKFTSEILRLIQYLFSLVYDVVKFPKIEINYYLLEK